MHRCRKTWPAEAVGMDTHTHTHVQTTALLFSEVAVKYRGRLQCGRGGYDINIITKIIEKVKQHSDVTSPCPNSRAASFRGYI